MNTHHQSASESLLRVVREFPGERMRIQDLMDGLGERSFGFVLLLFGLLSAIAIVPGLATITAIPLLFFGLQMIAGHATPWLPRSIAERNFLKRDLEATIQRGVGMMRWVEQICRPRLTFLTGKFMERVLGLLVFVLALIIALPGPGTNFPPGVTIAFMAIAIIERDGLLVLLGMVASVIALYIGYVVFSSLLPLAWDFMVDSWHALMP